MLYIIIITVQIPVYFPLVQYHYSVHKVLNCDTVLLHITCIHWYKCLLWIHCCFSVVWEHRYTLYTTELVDLQLSQILVYTKNAQTCSKLNNE